MALRLVRLAGWAVLIPFITRAQNQEGYTTKQRIETIRNLGKRDYTVIPTLAGYLGDQDREIRIEAVNAIVRIDTEHSLDALIQATHDKDAEVQIKATDGIVNAYLPGYVKSGLSGSVTRSVRQVKSYFSNRNDQVVEQGVIVRPDVAEALAEEIGGGADIDARSNAARAAGILRAQPAVPALINATHSRDSQMISECLVALQKIHDPSAGPGISFLAGDLDERVQIAALETIGMLRSLSSAPNVRSALEHGRDAKVRRAALESLAMLGIPGNRPVFQKWVQSSDPEMRAAALEGLGRIREPEDYPVIEAAYNDSDADSRVHLAAAFALASEGKMDTSEFSPLPYLFENLDNRKNSTIATAYLTELARRQGTRAALAKLIPEAMKDQKIALCSILAQSHAPDAVPVLTSLTKDIDPDVAFAASRALRTVQTHGVS
ncbi:MAG: HEAT repeat domain-containing protein [Acidobacteriaceae bacterium]|nr:HEAT repeat domain-containing protein [Acidobacteriaceae bacterium]MBV9498522.1 HEAT repeat domain-containing protein [Acidobacteriaceae bacterium]